MQAFRGASAAWERIDVNLRTPALRAPALRRALFTALDAGRLRAIGTAVYGGAEPMAGQLLLPDQPGYRDRLAGTGQGSGDLAAARRLLTAAGYTGVGTALVGPDHTPVPPLRGVFAAGNPARARVADYVTGVARGLGLTVTADPVEPGEYGGALSGGAFDLVYYGWAMPPAQLATARSSWTTGGPDNLIGYSNPQVDRLLAAAVADRDAAADLLGQADELITRDAVTLPLYRRPTLLAIRDEVANVRPNASGGPLYDVVEWGLRRS